MNRGDDGGLRRSDWGEGHAHIVPHYDFGMGLDGRLDDRAPAFEQLLAGSGLDREGYDAIRPDIWALRLLIATELVRSAIDRKPERLAAKIATLRALLDRADPTAGVVSQP